MHLARRPGRAPGCARRGLCSRKSPGAEPFSLAFPPPPMPGAGATSRPCLVRTAGPVGVWARSETFKGGSWLQRVGGGPKKSAPAHLRGGRGSLGRGYFVDALIECPGRGMGGELSETISQDSRSAREFHGPGTPSGPRLSSPRKSHREAPVLRPRSPPKKAPRLARSKPGFPGKGILFLCTGEWFLAGLCVEVFRGKEEKISDHQFGSGGPRRRIRAESPEALSALAFRTGFPHWLSVLAFRTGGPIKKVPRHTCLVAGAPWEGDILWMH